MSKRAPWGGCDEKKVCEWVLGRSTNAPKLYKTDFSRVTGHGFCQFLQGLYGQTKVTNHCMALRATHTLKQSLPRTPAKRRAGRSNLSRTGDPHSGQKKPQGSEPISLPVAGRPAGWHRRSFPCRDVPPAGGDSAPRSGSCHPGCRGIQRSPHSRSPRSWPGARHTAERRRWARGFQRFSRGKRTSSLTKGRLRTCCV